MRCELIALHSEPAAFGRYRTGCRIDSANKACERVIEEFVRANGVLGSTPSHRRRSPRVA